MHEENTPSEIVKANSAYQFPDRSWMADDDLPSALDRLALDDIARLARQTLYALAEYYVDTYEDGDDDAETISRIIATTYRLGDAYPVEFTAERRQTLDADPTFRQAVLLRRAVDQLQEEFLFARDIIADRQDVDEAEVTARLSAGEA